ncbi:MAG TPA: sulfurtransferase [Dehalococcoidia bacterium]|jgi:thiosulfate/3-mercaptopyruvate sulfurtransferase|nr:sulfurtransferase [Dehalococcoidia bacterium]
MTTETNSSMLVTTDWLASRLENPDFVLIDAGEADAYRRAHIPGAVGVPHPYLKGRGSDLVMDAGDFEKLAQRWGISNETPVVIYDDNASLHAARVWWVFQYFGHSNVRVVDGGFNAWLDEERPITSKSPRPETGSFSASVQSEQVCLIGELKDRVNSESAPAIWDTRSDAEWEGTETRGNDRSGRVPGAIHLEWRHLMQGPPARRFKPLEEIRSALVGAGLDPDGETVTYCQSGIRGAFGHFILALLGNESVRNYDGSMSEWTGDPSAPLVLG